VGPSWAAARSAGLAQFIWRCAPRRAREPSWSGALAIDEHAVVAEARAHANRLANADHANLVRASRAAHAQLQAIRLLGDEGRLARLSPALREIAELRLRHPSLSLRELAAKCRPPATKATAHRRLKRLVSLAGLEPPGV
jgi:DNA-binding protein WhiA